MTFTLMASQLLPVALMRLTEVKDADEVLTKHTKDDIVVEKKVDGWKVQVIENKGKIRIYSRRGEDVTGNFPEIVKSIKLPDGTLVEGELVYWDKGKQDVTKVTSLAGSSAEKAIEKAKELPGEMKLHLYDVLWSKGKNVTDKPFSERRKILESIIKPSKVVLLTEQYPFSKWQTVMNNAIKEGGEGIVLKLKSAKYHWKPKGQNEAKPADTMWKYKGGVGKHGSDDYVVYGTKESKTGKTMALFGQYYKNKLYAMSEIDNFSAENEAELVKRLKKGPFVIEIGFQERVPGGLRHQKFIRFRDDKKPKDATMHEFHVKHLDEFEPAVLERKAMFALAGVPDPNELVTTLEEAVYNKDKGTVSTNLDTNKMFKIMATLESGNRPDVVGDTGTSFGPTQVHAPYLLSRLSRMPNAENITGLSADEMKKLSTDWVETRKKLGTTNIWKEFPINEDVSKFPLVTRLEKTFIRRPDMIIEKRGDKFIGRALDLDKLRSLGFDVDSDVFKRIEKAIYSGYVTDNVALSTLSQALLTQIDPIIFQKYKRRFNSENIKKDKSLADLLTKASFADFSSRISAVVRLVEQAKYDTSVSGAYTLPQLIIISNASGIGAVQRFLLEKKPFGRGNLHYLQSSRVKKTLEDLNKKDPSLSPIINQILVGLPSGNGIVGFHKFETQLVDTLIEKFGQDFKRSDMIRMMIFGERAPEFKQQNIMPLIERWLNYEHIEPQDLKNVGINYIGLDWSLKPPTLNIWAFENAEKLRQILPKNIWGLNVVVHSSEPEKEESEFEEELTPTGVEAQMSPVLFSKYIDLLKRVREGLKKTHKWVPESEIRRTVFLHVAEELGYSPEQIKELFGEHAWLKFSKWISLNKYASMQGTIAFPGQYAEDIKSGKIEKTIRLADMPIEPEEIVTAVTYSGSVICPLRILSKESMSLSRIEKAFGKHVARSLEHKFGSNRRFVVIRFTCFKTNEADDGETLDKEKRQEILIDKDGVKLTRGQIYDHYAKPAIRKQIMARIKDKPVLVYLGIGKNEKILKRNHDNKQIVITNDSEENSEKPDNYWYWIKRRMLSIHEVFETKTDIGFVDLDLHGDYSLEKAKQYAKKLSSVIKEKYNVQPKIYQSGGTGLHIEFELKEKVSIDKLRKELKELLDKLNEDFEGATTGIVKGNGMRTDVSTLHNKGSLRVPGSLGETWGKEKKQFTDDDYGNNNFGGKYSDTGPFGDGGAITPIPYESSAPEQVGVWTASDRRKLFHIVGESK